MSTFHDDYQHLVEKGIIDDNYPVERLCVHLPNGWFGINAILSKYTEELKELGYEEEMVPSVSTNQIFSKIPVEMQGNTVESVLKITHTGLHKLDDPYFMAIRPDLIIPQIEMNYARSYRNLPIRRISGGYRYNSADVPVHYSLITDIEMHARDIVSILHTEEEYHHEMQQNIEILMKIIREDCKLSTFTIKNEKSIVIYAIFPNNEVLPVATVKLYGQTLSEAISFSVLGRDNKYSHPFIFSLHVDSSLFAATVVTHSEKERIILPFSLMRAHGFSFEQSFNFKSFRIDAFKKSMSPEIIQREFTNGAAFALVPSTNGTKIIFPDGKEIETSNDNLENTLNTYMQEREHQITEKENTLYQTRFSSIEITTTPNPTEGKIVLGLLFNNPSQYAIAKPLINLQN